jgi:fumarylacetoacetase
MSSMATPDVKRSWVHVAAEADFSIYNLPFGIFNDGKPRAGIAIGDFVVDLSTLHDRGYFKAIVLPDNIFRQSVLNEFFALGKKTVGIVRRRVMELLLEGNTELKNQGDANSFLIPLRSVSMEMPLRVGNYTDFYSSEEHATNVGSMFRDPKNALLPNWKHLPVGYHGRASSIVVSGTEIRRPKGQLKLPDSDQPVFGPTRKLDFELEMAFVTCTNTSLGHPIPINETDNHIIGFVLFNDWSARDIQQWEYVPLGPFLGKNFGSTISPWIVTMDALEPFRCEGPPQDPPVLRYLSTEGKHSFDILLEVLIEPQGSEATTVCRSNFKYLYWNINQQLAHHTVNGCNIQVGDLYASGTISGPSPGSYGSMLELSWNGTKPLHMPDGTSRQFIEDHDTVIMRAYAQSGNVRVGFGECRGRVVPVGKLTVDGG